MIYKLLKFELKTSNRAHHILRSSIYMMLLSILMFSITIPKEHISEELNMLICFSSLIFTFMITPPYLVKSDLNDGFLETSLSIFSPLQIILAKYLSLVLNLMISIFVILPIIMLVFNIALEPLIYLYSLMILTIFQIAGIIVFINILHAYFKKNTNLLISLILPIILPTIIISSIALSSLKIDFLMILLGLDLIMIPLIFCLSHYLLKNLYNF